MEGKQIDLTSFGPCFSFLLCQKKYEQEANRSETLQNRIVQLEEELGHRKQQSKILGQLQIDVKRLHSAFNALEVRGASLIVQSVFLLLSFFFFQVENTHLHNQLSLVHRPSVPIPN